MVAERTGRAIRKPSTDAMLSFAGKQMGSGWVFGINEALDQAGATIGPLIISLVLFLNGSYRTGFALLSVSAVITIGIVVRCQAFFPEPARDRGRSPDRNERNYRLPYWLYLLAGACVAAGFADFSLVAYHFQKTSSVSTDWIPIYYAVAMALGGIAALGFGKWFDKAGLPILIGVFFASAFFAPCVFLGGQWIALFGMVLWGIGMGAQNSLFKAVIAPLISQERRATGFGVFDAGFGIAWFLGSWLMGVLYDRSILGSGYLFRGPATFGPADFVPGATPLIRRTDRSHTE